MKEIFSLALGQLKVLIETSYIYLLIPACFLWLYFKEKKSPQRTFFLWGTVFLLFLYLCPISGKILFFCLGNNTYYRLFWLIPFIPLICYTATHMLSHLCGLKRFFLFLALLLCITQSGSFMLIEPNFHAVTNPYKLPQESIDTTNWIPDGALIVGDNWLVPFIRQYNPAITLLNTRQGHIVLSGELDKEHPSAATLCALLQFYDCDFIALGQDRNMDIIGDWEEYGFHFYRGDNRCIIFVNENSHFYIAED